MHFMISKHTNLFTFITIFLIIILPFYVFIKVFFEYQLGVSFFWIFIKEFLVVLLWLCLVYEFCKAKRWPRLDWLDGLILAYFAYGIGITLIHGWWIEALFYGGRYDFMFFVVFLILRHGAGFLQISLSKCVILFVWSGSISLLLGIIFKVIWEEFLTLFWYNYYVSNWTFQWSVPIYHWVEWSGLRRFQGILDGPNQMAFFLFVYLGAVFYFVKQKFEFHHGVIWVFLFLGILMTFSRSALLGLLAGIILLLLCKIRVLYSNYKIPILSWVVIVVLILWVLGNIFQKKIESIIIRPWSTQGHIERMEIWIDKFLQQPLWHGLGTSGPAYRNIFPGEITKKQEKEFIPESWFVQQLVEGGIIYFVLFCTILITILVRIYSRSPSFFIACIGVWVMNIFLHIFEATYISILLFLFLWLIISHHYA